MKASKDSFWACKWTRSYSLRVTSWFLVPRLVLDSTFLRRAFVVTFKTSPIAPTFPLCLACGNLKIWSASPKVFFFRIWMVRVFVCLHHEPVVLPFLSSSFHFKSLVFNSELVRRDTRSDEREREERSGKKNKGFGRDGEVWETFGDYSTFLEKRYRLTKELASEYISFAFVSFHKVECKKRGVQVGNARAETPPPLY